MCFWNKDCSVKGGRNHDNQEKATFYDCCMHVFFLYAVVWAGMRQRGKGDKITASLNISEQNSRHLVRMFRSFLEGFCRLVNKKSFGNPLPVSDTFALSVDTLIAGMKSLENK